MGINAIPCYASTIPDACAMIKDLLGRGLALPSLKGSGVEKQVLRGSRFVVPSANASMRESSRNPDPGRIRVFSGGAAGCAASIT
jgi:hypothetical protein